MYVKQFNVFNSDCVLSSCSNAFELIYGCDHPANAREKKTMEFK